MKTEITTYIVDTTWIAGKPKKSCHDPKVGDTVVVRGFRDGELTYAVLGICKDGHVYFKDQGNFNYALIRQARAYAAGCFARQTGVHQGHRYVEQPW